mmetsp:Transcript_26866/g.58626  ORF Transcript_26866/g.58626 Transcript_26866/m.58626 type:complete len:203 (-) Transcript_26866:771-1379(-)
MASQPCSHQLLLPATWTSRSLQPILSYNHHLSYLASYNAQCLWWCASSLSSTALTAFTSCPCSAAGAAMIPFFMVSRYRPLEKSRGSPRASVTLPPASSTITTPAAWSQIFSRYVGGGKRMKTRGASPLESRPYLTWLSMRRGGSTTPASRATLAVTEWLEWRLSTLSIILAREKSLTLATCTRTGSADSSHRGAAYAPCPL